MTSRPLYRWKFYDPSGTDDHTFCRNPRSMASMAPPHRTVSYPQSPIDSKHRAYRPPDLPFAWSFVGRVRSKSEYDDLLSWSHRQNRIHLRDHVGRWHEILPQRFVPTPVERSGVKNDWLFDYTFETIYFRRLS